MCFVSYVGDFYTDKFKQDPLLILPTINEQSNCSSGPIFISNITREEFDKLKKEVQEMKQLLIKAKIYDEQTGQPDCEMEEKIALLKHIAELVGVDLNEVFK